MLARFLDDFCVSEPKRALRRNIWSFWEVSGNGNTDKNEKNTVNSVFFKGFGMSED